jgi:hypothetical protein
MTARIIPKSRKELEERVDQEAKKLNDVLNTLADSLSEYGFKGNLLLDLTVEVTDKALRGTAVTLKRSTELPFKH